MAVYVDEMCDYGRRIGRAGPFWCHLMADTDEELHAIARAIGLRRAWFQGDHYDIGSERIRVLALMHGAVPLDGMEWVRTIARVIVYLTHPYGIGASSK